MFRPVHGIQGYLKSSVTDIATAVELDDSTVTLLQKMLPSSDYTYLMIRTGYNYEIVKTVSFTGAMLNVVRAQDGTTAQAFPQNSVVEFVLSQSAIDDIVSQQNIGLVTLTGSGIVTVTPTGPNAFNIDAPAVAITSDSEKILVGGDFPNFVLSSPVVDDCCA